MNNSYLMHHGIKGMKWGVRRYEDANGHLTPAGKRRYAIQDARKYYKINRLERARENTTDPDKRDRLNYRIRRVQTRSDRKRADLSQRDINIGREIVAKHRKNLRVSASVLTGAATVGAAKKLPYYHMENRRYKQVNPKGSTKKGLTKKQQALRTAGKVAAGAALAGVAGYTLYKSGAGQAAINAGKNALEARTGIKFGKIPARISTKKSILLIFQKLKVILSSIYAKLLLAPKQMQKLG